MRAHFSRTLFLMEQLNTWNLGLPHVRHIVNTNLYEIRLKGKSGIARAIFISLEEKNLIILNVFIKKDEKTPRKEIEISLKRLKEIQND
jgi:phage-related protein